MPIPLFLFGILLFAVSLWLANKNKGDLQSLKIYRAAAFIGFLAWSGVSFYILYDCVLHSFDIADCLILACFYNAGAALILEPVFVKHNQKPCSRWTRILTSAICALLLMTIKIALLIGNTPAAPAVDSGLGFQKAYDNSDAMREYTDAVFRSYMDGQEYNITNTAYGFVVSDESYYIVAYQYENNGEKEQYGYKLVMDEHGGYSIIEEGTEIAAVVYS